MSYVIISFVVSFVAHIVCFACLHLLASLCIGGQDSDATPFLVPRVL